MIGDTCGDFTIIDVNKEKGYGAVTLRCPYGHVFTSRLYDLKKKNRNRTCRDCRINSGIAYETGNSYGDLTIMHFAHRQNLNKRPSWLKYVCICSCGRKVTMKLCDIKIYKSCKRCK